MNFTWGQHDVSFHMIPFSTVTQGHLSFQNVIRQEITSAAWISPNIFHIHSNAPLVYFSKNKRCGTFFQKQINEDYKMKVESKWLTCNSERFSQKAWSLILASRNEIHLTWLLQTNALKTFSCWRCNFIMPNIPILVIRRVRFDQELTLYKHWLAIL